MNSDVRRTVQAESNYVFKKKSRLAQFIDTDEFKALSSKQQGLLRKQLRAMTEYFNILQERLKDDS